MMKTISLLEAADPIKTGDLCREIHLLEAESKDTLWEAVETANPDYIGRTVADMERETGKSFEVCRGKIPPDHIRQRGTENTQQNLTRWSIQGKRVPCRSIAPGHYFIIPERMDDGNDSTEIRLSLYRREEGEETVKLPHESQFLKNTYFGMIQGFPNEKPRYKSTTASGRKSLMPPEFPVIPTDIKSLEKIILPEDPKPSRKKKEKNENCSKP